MLLQKIEYTIEFEDPQEGKPSEEFNLSGEWGNKSFLILSLQACAKKNHSTSGLYVVLITKTSS